MKQNRCALIDLGSNTVKLCIYELSSCSFRQLHYEACYGYVIRYIQNSLLTQEGIEKINAILSDFSHKAKQWECQKIICFSTASLRYIKNIQFVINNVYSTTGIKINPISGEEEALCNFESLRSITKSPDFLGADIGGGSVQIFSVQNNTLKTAQSFPMGSLKLYTEFVHNTLPTVQETEKIRRYVRCLLDSSKIYTDFTGFPLHFMGGTVRLITKLIGKQEFTPDQLGCQLDFFLSHPEQARQRICAVTPQRLQTVIPGMTAVHTIAEYFHVSNIIYTQNSVREGYLTRHLLKRPE